MTASRRAAGLMVPKGLILATPLETVQTSDEIAWIIERDELFWLTLGFGIRNREHQLEDAVRFRE